MTTLQLKNNATKYRKTSKFNQAMIFVGMMAILIQTAEAVRITPNPQIFSVEIDRAQHQLTISGVHLGSNAPHVTLGGRQFNVRKNSSTDVVVDLPPSLHPANYRLTISATQGFIFNESIDVYIPDLGQSSESLATVDPLTVRSE